jgi:hypothetical protein
MDMMFSTPQDVSEGSNGQSAKTQDLFGFAEESGQHRVNNAVRGLPDGVPISRSSHRRTRTDHRRSVMTTPDLFSAFDAEAATNNVFSDDRLISGGKTEIQNQSHYDNFDQPAAGSAKDTEDDRRPSSHSLPTLPVSNRLKSRFAGDIVVCSIKPATFDEAIMAIKESGTVEPDRVKAFEREVRWVQTRLPRGRDGSPPPPLPCHPEQLRQILKLIVPGRHEISKKRWYNIRCELAAIQRKTGWLTPRASRVEINSPEWQFVTSSLDGDPAYAMVRNWAVFCEGRGIMPSEVGLTAFEEYQAHLEQNTSKRAPKQTCEALRYVWNRLTKHCPTWGGKPLPRKRSPQCIRGDKNDLSLEFYEDLEAYLAKLLNPGRYARGAFNRPASAKTIQSRRDILTLSGHILRQAGWEREQLTSLHQMAHPNAVQVILDAYHDRNCPDGKWTVGAETTAVVLKMMARQWSKLLPADLSETEAICSSVRPPLNSYPRRAATRLRQFDDRAVERRFWALPQMLWEEAKKHEAKKRLKLAATYAKYALALAISFDKPLRVTNLASLDLGLDFERDRKGNIVSIKIEGERTTKGAAIIEGALTPPTQRKLKEFCDKYRPRLLKNESSALFPGDKSEVVNQGSFGRHITELVHRHLGIDVNPHLIRALVATVILDENPEDVVLAQRMLDHKSPETTKKYYAQQRGRAIQGRFADVLHRRMKKLQK